VSGSSVPDTSGNNNDLILHGAASEIPGDTSPVLHLDGPDGGYAQLPADILSRSKDLTISTWVKLDTIGQFSRIFDFGNNAQEYMFLTPGMLNGKLGFAISTSGNGAETQILTDTALTAGAWTHLRLTIKHNADGRTSTGTIYVNGQQAGQNTSMALSPADLGRTMNNYLGKSQFPDPNLSASFEDFRIDGEVIDTAPAVTNPAIAGEPTVGSVLQSQGAVSPKDAVVDWQWLRDGQPIPAATGNSYKATEADLGHEISVSAVATKFGFGAAATVSPNVTIVQATTPTSGPTPAASAVTAERPGPVGADEGSLRSGLANTGAGGLIETWWGAVLVLLVGVALFVSARRRPSRRS
jgi:hypothetical protein